MFKPTDLPESRAADCQDRGGRLEGDFDEALSLCDQGIELWQDGTEFHTLLASDQRTTLANTPEVLYAKRLGTREPGRTVHPRLVRRRPCKRHAGVYQLHLCVLRSVARTSCAAC
jgi:hypothetical protein